MNKKYRFHILTSYFIIISGFMLIAQDSQALKEKYMREKGLDINTLDISEKKMLEETMPVIEKETITIPITNKIDPMLHFGYDYFLKRQSISFYDNLPVHDHYQFGPGDEIIINIWGDIQLQSSYAINKEGNVYIDKLGQLSIVGKTISQAETFIKKRFEVVFSTMGGDSPSTFFDLSIGKLKSININIIGEVSSPGMHSLHPFSTISTALIQSGGIDTIGTLRSIKLISKGNKSSEFDFYDFLISGELANDVHLKDGDIIFVPLRNSSITISGEVARGAIYELTDNEYFGDLLRYCGGLKITAQDMVKLNRIIPLEDRQFEDYAREVTYIKSSDLDFNLRDGDNIYVTSIMDVNQSITIKGTVKKSGEFPFIADMTIMDIMKLAGGLNDESFVQTMDLEKVELVRRESNKEYPLKFDINVNNIINGDSTANLRLKNWDVIHVRRNINFDPPEMVEITGEVRSPGSYTIVKKIETINNIINRSGGYTDRAHKEGIKIFRGDNQIILKNFDMPLIDQDSIRVPKHTSVVQITGEIYHSGYVQYIKNKNVAYYIESAGGFTLEADQNSIMVIYANGDIDIKRRWHKLKIAEGSHIVVQSKKEREEFDFTEFLKEVSSIAASLTAIIYIVTFN